MSDLEKEVISFISSKVEPIATAKLLEDIQIPPSELFSAIPSLERRSWIEKQARDNQTIFILAPVVKQYVKTQYSHRDE